MSQEVHLNKLVPHCDPFETPVWHELYGKPITREEVAEAVAQENLKEDPCVPYCFGFSGVEATRQEHIERVAYLVVNGWIDPIDIDLNSRDWVVVDGNHRLAAAIFRGDKLIGASIAGDVAEIDWLTTEGPANE